MFANNLRSKLHFLSKEKVFHAPKLFDQEEKRQIPLSILSSFKIIRILLDNLSYEETHSSDLVVSVAVFSKCLFLNFIPHST